MLTTISFIFINTIEHNLVIQYFLYINLEITSEGDCYIRLNTLNGSFVHQISWGLNTTGIWQVLSSGSTLNNCKVSIINKNFNSDFWIFGASYETLGSSARWPYHLKDLGVEYSKILWNGYPGRDSASSYADFLKCVECAKPKYIYWTMWGNGSASSLESYITRLYNYCYNNDIKLIIIDRPNATEVDDYIKRKEVIAKFIDLGIKYVNASDALSKNKDDENGWYDGYLSSDGKHPTILGARALAYQVVLDIPEITQKLL